MSSARVELECVTHSYRSGSPVLRDLDLRVSEGEVLVVRGRNGAGKTTLLRLAAGLLRPSSGDVRRQGLVGYLPQRGDSPPPRMSAGAWLTTLSRMRGGQSGLSPSSLLQALHVDAPTQPMDQLSVGTVGKVMLAGALGGRPDLLVLDEPFAPLDPVACAAAASLVAEAAAAGASVLLSDHQGAAASIATRIVALAGGQLQEEAADPGAVRMWRLVTTDATGQQRDLLVPEGDRDMVLLRLLTDGARVARVEEVT